MPVLGPAASAIAPPARPTAPSERIATIDVLRGVAMLGILLENILFFSGPFQQWDMQTPPWPGALDQFVVGIIQWLEQGKMYCLYALLFGFGLAPHVGRERGHTGLVVRRLLALLAVGVAHAVLIWAGDILATYALLGFLLLPFLARRPRTLLVWSGLAWFGPMLLAAVLTVALIVAAQVSPEFRTQMDQNEAARQTELVAAATREAQVYGHGTWAEVTQQRMVDARKNTLGLAANAPNIFLMLLLGVYASRQQLFRNPEQHAMLIRRLSVGALGIGLALHAVYAYINATTHVGVDLLGLASYLAFAIGLPLLTLGYGAGIVRAMQGAAARRLLAPLAAVGEMSLSNYLLQSLVCTTLCYGYGFALYGKISPAASLIVTAALFAAQVVISNLWLARFRFGPAEWLWRVVTYGRAQPVLRAGD